LVRVSGTCTVTVRVFVSVRGTRLLTVKVRSRVSVVYSVEVTVFISVTY